MFRSIFKIRKISDLSQICIMPVMILSIFLTFYLYIDMGKIEKKSEELVNNAVPHVLAAQQGAISLVHLKRSVEIMTESVDLQRARKAYIKAHILVSESVFANSDYLQQKGNSILYDVNRLWKLRLQLDELRATLSSSLSYMDSLMFLVYNEQPLLFPEFDAHVNNYTDLYSKTTKIRDIKGQHEFYYRVMLERLSENFDRESFLREQYRNHLRSRGHSMTGDAGGNYVLSNDRSRANMRSGNPDLIMHGDLLEREHKKVATEHGAVSEVVVNGNGKGPNIEEEAEREQKSGRIRIDGNVKNRSMPVISADPVLSSNYAVNSAASVDVALKAVRSPVAASMQTHFKYLSSNNKDTALSRDFFDELDRIAKEQEIDPEDGLEIYMGKLHEVHNYPTLFKSNIEDLKYLAVYRSELDRFNGLWSLYLKLQTVFVKDSEKLSDEVDKLAHSFTSGETSVLHGELSDISLLAGQIKPMVMMTVGFCLLGFWFVILVMSRYIIAPLKSVVRAIITFRRTRKVDSKLRDTLFKQEHVMEIREIVDILPKLFDDISSIEHRSSMLNIEYRKLLNDSKMDGLTKVLNRGTLNQLGADLGLDIPANFAVLMMDIDHFKKLNDTMGHQKGDEVLFAVAQTLKKHISKRDLVFRYGGEEFCVVLTGISPVNAYKVADRLCRRVRALKLINEGVPDGIVTISVGISLVTSVGGQFRLAELISQADKALYIAKRTGRNQAVACPKTLVFGMDEHGAGQEARASVRSDAADSLVEAGPDASDRLAECDKGKVIVNNDAMSLLSPDGVGHEERDEMAGRDKGDDRGDRDDRDDRDDRGDRNDRDDRDDRDVRDDRDDRDDRNDRESRDDRDDRKDRNARSLRSEHDSRHGGKDASLPDYKSFAEISPVGEHDDDSAEITVSAAGETTFSDCDGSSVLYEHDDQDAKKARKTASEEKPSPERDKERKDGSENGDKSSSDHGRLAGIDDLSRLLGDDLMANTVAEAECGGLMDDPMQEDRVLDNMKSQRPFFPGLINGAEYYGIGDSTGDRGKGGYSAEPEDLSATSMQPFMMMRDVNAAQREKENIERNSLRSLFTGAASEDDALEDDPEGDVERQREDLEQLRRENAVYETIERADKEYMEKHNLAGLFKRLKGKNKE